jgi:transposase
VDLLPDRRAESFAAWLLAHPGVEVISRDRAGAYADGARQGAPAARQIADRFHLLRNLADALEAVLIRLHAELCAALQLLPSELASPLPNTPMSPPETARIPSGTTPPSPIPHRRSRRAVALRAARRAQRVARYDEVQKLHRRGWSLVAIARQLGLNRNTVSKWVHQDHFCEHQTHHRRGGLLDPHKEYLQQRWQEGDRTARQLWAELRERGYPGGYTRVASYLAEVRQAHGMPLRRGGLCRPAQAAACPASQCPPITLVTTQAGWGVDDRRV